MERGPRPRLHTANRPIRAALRAIPLAAALAIGTPSFAQLAGEPENPVFIHDSPSSADALIRVGEFLAGGNTDQAARVLQRLLDEQAASLVASPDDPTLFVSVRARVHAVLLASRELLAAYRQAQEPRADELLGQEAFTTLRESRLFTASGLEAALRVAGDQMEAADFDAAARTLEELAAHPDLRPGTPREPRRAAAAARAARLATTLQRYRPDPATAALAREWSLLVPAGTASEPSQPGPDAGTSPITGPPRPPRRAGLVPQPPADLTGLVAQPLATATFWTGEPSEPQRLPPGVTSADQLPRTARELRIMPELVGETLYVAGGRTIAAFDRLTLQERWRADVAALLGIDAATLEQSPAERQGPGRAGAFAWEDIRAVSVRDPFAVAVASIDNNANGQGEAEALVALDTRRGTLRWASAPRDLSDDLERARIRGPVHIAGDLAIVTLRKELRDRRLWALYTAGVDLRDGSARWVRLLASAGSLPFYRQVLVADGGVVHAGVLYQVDRLGVVAAVDAATGWPIWVRRLAPEPFEPAVNSAPWQISLPIVDGDRLILLSPDRTQILVLDRAGGRTLAAVPASTYDQPAYLLAAGDRLVGVNEQRITIGSLKDPAREPHAATPRAADPGIRGRVAVVGSRLLVPLAGSAWVVDTASPSRPQVLPLDHGGTFLAFNDQLLAVDDARVYAYLPWPSADRLLSERIEQGDDPVPAIVLLELAYRAGHPERMAYAVEAGRRLIASRGESAGGTDRPRLAAALQRLLGDGLLDRPRRDPEASTTAAVAPVRPLDLGDDLRQKLLDHLAALAADPAERAAHALLLARHHERANRLAQAVSAYQSVLADAALADATWTGEAASQRAGADATRRVQRLVARSTGGRAAYAAFDREADAAIAALSATPTPESMQPIAERYPAARAVPALWSQIGEAHEVAARPRAAARAYELGLRSAEGDPSADRAAIAELAGRLLTNLRDRGLLTAAEETLRSTQQRYAGLVPTRRGQPLDLAGLSAELSRSLAQARRWPRVGPPTAAVQTLTGWAVMEPAIRPTVPATPPGLVLRHEDGRVGYFAPTAGALEPRWVSAPTEDPAELVRLDRHAALVFFATARGGVLERIDTQAGQSAWRSEPFPTLFTDPAAATRPDAGERVRTPVDGLRALDELLVCSDERAIGLIERTGRAAVFDADSGAVLWAAALPLNHVFDADVAGDVLAVAGERDEPGVPGGLMAPKPVVMVIDARTGRVTAQFELEGGPIRWLRLTSRGELIIGLRDGIASLDPEAGAVAWKNTEPAAVETLRAWEHAGSVYLLARDRTLWRLATAGGTLDPRPIDAGPRLDTAGEPQIFALDDSRLALASPQGLTIFSAADGTVVGADALGGGDGLLTPQPGAGVVLALENATTTRPGVGAVGNLHVLDAASGRLRSTTPLVLGETPVRMALLDDRLAVTAGHTTVIYRAEAK